MAKDIETEISEICERLKVPGPVGFQTMLMAGKDPRGTSEIYRLVKEIEKELGEGELPDEFWWETLVNAIKRDYKPMPVPLDVSQKAAKELGEYANPKKRSVDVNANVKVDATVTPLTRRDVRTFEKKFNRDY